jgi:hypothetical protein
MLFDVMFSIDAPSPEAAAEEVSGWRVAPGAILKFIVSSQPIVVMGAPQKVAASGEVGEIHVGDQPPVAPVEQPLTLVPDPIPQR